MTRLSPDEAKRALYIDFEGRKLGPPVLLGCTRRSKGDPGQVVTQFVIDERLAPLSDADGIELMTLSDVVERILQRAERKDRRIVAWSEHELNVVKDHCPDKLERFLARYVNARAVAEYWRNKCHGGSKPKPGALAEYLVLIGYDVPQGAGPGRAGETIGILLAAMESGRGAVRLTANQLNRWRDLREHNRHDCMGMRRVSIRATQEIAAKIEHGEAVRPARQAGPTQPESSGG